MRRASRVLLVVLVGCGGGAQDDVAVSPVPITFHSGSVLFAAVEAQGTWHTMAPSSRATFEIDGPYPVVEVCNTNQSPETIVWMRSISDGADVQLPCSAPLGAVLPVTIDTGGAAAIVYLGEQAVVTPSANATVYLAPGTYDLVAYPSASNPPQALIVRGVVVNGPQTVTIDLSGATALEARDVTSGGAPLASYQWIGDLHLTHTDAQLPTWVQTPAYVVPTSALAAGDREDVEIEAYAANPTHTGVVRQWQRQPVGDGAIDVMLPDALTGVQLSYDGAITASWSTTASWPRVDLEIGQSDGSGHYRTETTRAFAGYLADTGVSGSMTGFDPTTVPGWNPVWNIDRSLGYDLSVGLSDEPDDDHGTGVSWSDRVSPP